MTGDFTNSFKAFERLTSRRNSRLSDQQELFEILDVFDGTVDIIEQSIIGDVKGAYKKAKSFAKWLFINIYNQIYNRFRSDENHEWSTYG